MYAGSTVERPLVADAGVEGPDFGFRLGVGIVSGGQARRFVVVLFPGSDGIASTPTTASIAVRQ